MAQLMKKTVALDCGWGRLIFGQTYDAPEELADTLQNESEGRRDVAFYVQDPHVVLASAPQTLFLDPSHSYRLGLNDWTRREDTSAPSITIRDAAPADEPEINRLYQTWAMVSIPEGFCDALDEGSPVRLFVAQEQGTDGPIVGVAMGVDHRRAFNDPDNGSSLWALAVDPQSRGPGVGRALVGALASHFRDAGRSFMDLSVVHDNREAISLYEQLGFDRVPVYAVKRKNPINEKLFVGPQPEDRLNPYAKIIADEARRRGITVEIEDAEAGIFRLSHGGRVISCRESLSDLTSAVALSRCDDKRLTRRILKRAGLSVPNQIVIEEDDQIQGFLEKFGRVVVKPARGEMGTGVAVDLQTFNEVREAVARAREHCDDVLVEEYVEGHDLRIIVIGNEVAAAAVRRPPAVRGDGVHTIAELIGKLSRRRKAATDGESQIPIDDETRRCVGLNGYGLTDVLGEGETLTVRKTANLHTGGTIHDVTEELNAELARAAIEGARTLGIPVVGFDFMVPDPKSPDYVVIEANERPGLANHEPQPTAEKFVDLLFPQTRAEPEAARLSA